MSFNLLFTSLPKDTPDRTTKSYKINRKEESLRVKKDLGSI